MQQKAAQQSTPLPGWFVGLVKSPEFRAGCVLFWCGFLAACILGSSMSFVDGSVVNLALPTLQRSLGATVTDVQWVVESYALFLASLLLIGGALGDRVGRRRVFAWGVALFAASSVACGLAPRPGWLIGARAVQGIGAALGELKQNRISEAQEWLQIARSTDPACLMLARVEALAGQTARG